MVTNHPEKLHRSQEVRVAQEHFCVVCSFPPPGVFIVHNMSQMVRPAGHSKASLTFRLPQCSKKKKKWRDEGIYYFERRESMRVELKPSLNEPALPAVTDHANAAASLVEHHDFTLHVLAGQAFKLILLRCFCDLLSHSAVKCGPSVRFLLAKFIRAVCWISFHCCEVRLWATL